MFERLPREIIRMILMLLCGRDYLLMRRVNQWIHHLIDSNTHAYIRDNCRIGDLGGESIPNMNQFIRHLREHLIECIHLQKPLNAVEFTHSRLPIHMKMSLRGYLSFRTCEVGVFCMIIGTRAIVLPIKYIISDDILMHVIEFTQDECIKCRPFYQRIMAFIETYFSELYELITISIVI
jgi:hypothetical protein